LRAGCGFAEVWRGERGGGVDRGSLVLEDDLDLNGTTATRLQVRWCRSSNATRMLLSTNDKTVKLWKVYEKKVACLANFNLDSRGAGVVSTGRPPNALANVPRLTQPLHMPKVTSTEILLAARCKKVYANAHTYHINSISVNSDGETFLSADDLRVNLWNLEVAEQSFNIVDIKPSNMEDLTEVITSAEFHPTHCNVLAYSSSKGCIRLADMRASALCDNHAKVGSFRAAS
jgi:serine/threonine-protein phosphatase 2A regulatory subunit B